MATYAKIPTHTLPSFLKIDDDGGYIQIIMLIKPKRMPDLAIHPCLK
jgi:hypothetical protein